MAADYNVIALKLDQIEEKQEKTEKKVTMLTGKVLDPEVGLYPKIQVTNIQSKQNQKDIEKINASISSLIKVCENNSTNLATIESWVVRHEERDDALRDDVHSLTKSIKDYTEKIEEKFKESEKELEPLRNDFTIRNSNKKWKDKLMWIIIAGLVSALVLPPIVSIFKGGYGNSSKVEVKTQTRKK